MEPRREYRATVTECGHELVIRYEPMPDGFELRVYAACAICEKFACDLADSVIPGYKPERIYPQ